MSRPGHLRGTVAIALLGALLGASAVACATTGPMPSSGAGARSTAPGGSIAVRPSPSAIGDGRRADLGYLLERLEAIHPNPFLDEGETGFRARLDALASQADGLTDAGFLVGVMDLMGHRDRDGHSGAWGLAQTGDRLHAWPIWLWDFPDGLRIVAARAPYEDFVGARVVAVRGVPVAEASAAVEPLVPRDNPSTLRGNLPMHLTMPEILDVRGVGTAADPSLTIEATDGSRRDVDLEALPIEAFRDWLFERYEGYPSFLPPDPDGLAVQRHRRAFIWTEPLRGGGTYVGFDQVLPRQGPEGTTMSDVTHTIEDAQRAGRRDPLIVDLRPNPGGDNTTYGLLRSAIEHYALDAPGRVALLTSRGTFSAAGNFVTDLKVGRAGPAITLVGEPPGGGPNIYGDVRVVTLPATKVVVLISSRYHERWPGSDRLELPVDIPAEIGWEDLVARRDPVLEAATAATRASPERPSPNVGGG